MEEKPTRRRRMELGSGEAQKLQREHKQLEEEATFFDLKN